MCASEHSWVHASVCEHLGALMGSDVCTNVFVSVSDCV